MKLYIANKNYSSWSLRPWVLMNTLGITFSEQIVPLESGSSHETYRQFSPNGLVPCLHDGDKVVWESLAITEYLAESHPQVWPVSKVARAWARCASAEMHAGYFALRSNCTMNCGVRMRLHSVSAALKQDLDRLDELFNEGLSQFGGPYLAGEEFTAVDAFFAPVAFRIQTFDLSLSKNSLDYVKRLLNLDAMREWYTAALAESWREPGHEKEMLEVGELLEDLRESI